MQTHEGTHGKKRATGFARQNFPSLSTQRQQTQTILHGAHRNVEPFHPCETQVKAAGVGRSAPLCGANYHNLSTTVDCYCRYYYCCCYCCCCCSDRRALSKPCITLSTSLHDEQRRSFSTRVSEPTTASVCVLDETVTASLESRRGAGTKQQTLRTAGREAIIHEEEQRHARSASSGVDGETNRARGTRERRPPPPTLAAHPHRSESRVIPLSRLVIHPITSVRHPRQPARF